MKSKGDTVTVNPGNYGEVSVEKPTEAVIKDCDCFGGANMYQVEVQGKTTVVTDLNINK